MSTVWIVWSALGLAGWWTLLRRAEPAEKWRVPGDQWHPGDIVIAGIFALLIVLGILGGKDEARAITLDDVKGGASVYLAITLLVLGLAAGRRSPRQMFGLAPAQPGRVIALGIAGILMTFPLVQLLQEVAMHFGESPSAGDGMVQFLLGQRTGPELAWSVGLAVVVAPVTEELVFRGYLYGVIKRYGGRVAGMLTSAALFAAMHQNVPALPAFFVLAIGFTLVYELTGSLWAPITMHGLFNLVPVVVILGFPEWLPKN